MAKKHDVVVIGAGPGGYVAAIRASQLGFDTAIVEDKHMGGICLNWGCIPTKALLRASEIAHLMSHADAFGFTKVKQPEFDLKKVIKRSRGVAEKLSNGISHLMKKHKVTVYDGFGSLNGKGKIKVEKKNKRIADIQAEHIILATGARARSLPGLEADGKQIVTYKDAMVPTDMPKKLLVVGSGAIGIEFASFYRHMGADVTVVELADRVLPVEDAEISKLARKQFEKYGMEIHTETTVASVDKKKNHVSVVLDTKGKKKELKVDRIIVAVGIAPNVENLGLQGTKVKQDQRGHIKTDAFCRTDEPGVYAIGDITGAPWLAHKASHEGVICVEKIAGKPVHPMKKENIPGCTYCMPQIASVGLTEAAAKEQGYELKIGRFPYVGNGKAIALGEEEGLIKTIFDAKTGELLGAHMIGAEVTELINGYLVGKTMEATEEDFMHTIFPHPTLSEMMHEAVLDAFGRALHI